MPQLLATMAGSSSEPPGKGYIHGEWIFVRYDEMSVDRQTLKEPSESVVNDVVKRRRGIQ